MADRHIFPREEEAFNDYIIKCLAWLIKFQTRLKVSDDDLLVLIDLVDEWKDNWTLYLDITKQTQFVNQEKGRLRKLIEAAFRVIYGDIPASAFLADDRTTFNLKGQATGKGSKIKVVDYAPAMALETNAHLNHTLRFHDPTRPESNDMPNGHDIYLESFVGEPNMKDADIPFANGMKVTHQLYAVPHTEGDVGKTCYYRSFYENTPGKRGPQSWILKVVVS